MPLRIVILLYMISELHSKIRLLKILSKNSVMRGKTRLEKYLLLESKTESLVVVEKLIDEISTRYNFGQKLYGKILVVVLESVQNAIKHGNQYDPKKLVDFRVKLTDNKLVILTRDQGDGFNITNVPDPTSLFYITESSGRGTFLMKKLSDELNYYEGGRVVEMIFHLTAI
jgi:serine/threonine-protein kinase RsbW